MATPSNSSTSPIEAGDDDVAASASATQRLSPILIGILAIIAAGGITDLVLDRPTTLLSVHVAFEAAMVLLSLGSIVVLWRVWRSAASDLATTQVTLAATRRSLAERQAERDAWRENAEGALAGLGVAIDRQFARWELTPTEREIALLLLQGHGHKQIAARTARAERTVRQHAVSIYQKAGLGGRAELAAFFLQDLMLPETPEDAPPQAARRSPPSSIT